MTFEEFEGRVQAQRRDLEACGTVRRCRGAHVDSVGVGAA